jgi:choline dehydrogenase-like flavoprotein
LYLSSDYSHNTAFIEVERGGECQVTIRGQTNEQCLGQARITFHQVSAALRRLGAFVLPRTFREIPLGQDAHYGGTLPMNRVTSKEGEVLGHNQLFAVDGSVLGRLSATSPTLTIMANADRIGSIVADRLRHETSDHA